MSELSPRRQLPSPCLLSVAVLFGLLQAPVSLAQQPPSVEDVIAAVKHSQNMVSDYRAECRTTKTWSYEAIVSNAGMALGNHVPPEVVRWEKKPDNEPLKALRMSYCWLKKGAKFAGEFDVNHEIGTPRSYREKYAFDGQRHKALYTFGDSLSGVITGPSAKNRGMSELILTPDHFYSYFERRSLVDWLSEPKADMTVAYADYGGRRCLLIEYVIEGAPFSRARFWFDPEKYFATVSMEKWGSGQSGRVYRTTELVEALPGVWLPLKGVHEYYFTDPAGSGKPVVYCTTEFEMDPKTLAVNTGIPDSEFTFAFPQGTRLSDLVTGERTIVGGKPLTPEESIDKFLEKAQTRPDPSIEVRTGTPATTQTPPTTPVAPEPPPPTRPPKMMIVIIVIAVIALIGVLVAVAVRAWKARGPGVK